MQEKACCRASQRPPTPPPKAWKPYSVIAHKKIGIKSREEQHYPTSDLKKATSRGHACRTHKTPQHSYLEGFPGDVSEVGRGVLTRAEHLIPPGIGEPPTDKTRQKKRACCCR